VNFDLGYEIDVPKPWGAAQAATLEAPVGTP
jgi:hypothetical protein